MNLHLVSFLEDSLDPLIENLNDVIDYINVIATGAKLDEYEFFRKLVPNINITVGGKVYCHLNGNYEELHTKENCYRAFSFLYNLILDNQV